MTVHAFVDESKRGRQYYLSAAVADPSRLAYLRRACGSLLLPGQREIHFAKEKERRRRSLADAFARLPVEVRAYVRTCVGPHEEPARAVCLVALVQDLVDRGARRLVIDSRQERDKADERVIREVLGKQPSATDLVYEHLESGRERLLWIADAAGWCYGAGGAWRQRVGRITGNAKDLD